MTETEALAALNALHSPDPDGWKPGTSTDYMTCKGCDVLTLGGGCRRLWKDCPTRAILARVGSGAVPPDGWFPFGSHVDFDGPLEFSPELDEGGLPFWERHVGSGAVPPHDIDRDALVSELKAAWGRVADRILAHARPGGVTLTPEEVRDAARAARALADHQDSWHGGPDEMYEESARMRALAERLEASS